MFFALTLKVLPVYTTILLGFIAGRVVKLDCATIGKLLFYSVGPTVVFFGILKINITPEFVFLPIITFVVCCAMSLIVYNVSSLVFRDHIRNMLAFSSGSSGMGFFGLPVAIALFDEGTVSIYLLCYVGMLFFENSFGFYIATRGLYTPQQCFKKLITLPTFHAAVAALLCNHFKVHMPEFLLRVSTDLASTYMVLGTMLLGISVANIKDFSINWKLMVFTVLIKYVAWPLLALLLIFLDRKGPCLYDSQTYQAFILLAIIPISSTGVILAYTTNYKPDVAAIMLLISTVIGIFYVPFMISLLLY
ncbi:putative permease [Anaplasma centrale str. Israel]|uniref:Putative permease n=1 Tax=Anaplasma centrale (strain Israel) TaxID=574556 RepID=D1AT28_ANACI|nr:permease [Anaplasma centrale]ACZ49631.1 putative permease [Anaplasma centrale str. Israel]